MTPLEHITKQVNIIKCECASYYGLTTDDMNLKTRARDIVQLRYLSMYFIHKYFQQKLSLVSIGSYVSGKDHSTVIHAIKTINNLIETDRTLKRQVEEIETRISSKIIVSMPEPTQTVKFPINASLDFATPGEDKPVMVKIIYDGSRQQLTIMNNGIPQSQVSGIDALSQFKQYINNITL